jgi:hypothetical protein
MNTAKGMLVMKVPNVMTNDWSAFTRERVLALLEKVQDVEAPGYLVWAKIDHDSLLRPNLGTLLSADLSGVYGLDPFIANLRATKDTVLMTAETLRARGVTHIATGISWCDWVLMPSGKEWITWYVREFAKRFTVLPRITFTPPNFTDGGSINAPPLRPVTYAEFLHELLTELGDAFGDYVELWNEWNLDTDWRQELDPGFATFMPMIAAGALVAHHHGKKAALGGMAGITHEDIELHADFVRAGLFRYMDATSFHDLRGTWGDQVPSAHISEQVAYVRGTLRTPVEGENVLDARVSELASDAQGGVADILRAERSHLHPSSAELPVWLTEYGFPVIDPEDRFSQEYLEDIQVALFAYATYAILAGDVERVYWYTHRDYIGTSVRAHTTGWEDVLQYYYGDSDTNGVPRKLGRLLDEGGPRAVLQHAVEHDLFPLVDASSLGRKLPKDYRSNKAARK